jgi:hypothetical protein
MEGSLMDGTISGLDLSQIHSNLKLLSHSSVLLLHKCPRKYELYKLLGGKQEADNHLDFGDVVGRGIQEYLISGSLNKAYMVMFLAWPKALDDEDGQRDKKTFWFALNAIDKFAGYRNSILGRYQLAYFDGKPAAELGFSIDLGDGFYYRGFLDALLVDKMRNELLVLECKTTKNREVHPAMYENSSQGLGYSLISDAISKALGTRMEGQFKVHYCVFKTGEMEWQPMPFTKSHTDRALWIQDMLNDKNRVVEYHKNGYFPMHGETCYDFFRPCPHFGTCKSKYLVDMDEVVEKKDEPSKYAFSYSIEQIIEAQLAKHEANS